MFDRINEGRWWDFGWQLVEGCTKVSPGCNNCWSMAKEKRFRKETGVAVHSERLGRPLKRKKPASYAIWNDLFHPDVPFDFIDQVFAVIALCPQHIFQILTKRPERMYEYFTDQIPLINCMLGITAENQEMADLRIPQLLRTPAAVRFISVEPMLGKIDMEKYLTYGLQCNIPSSVKNSERREVGLHLIICGGESGPGSRPMQLEWAQDLRDQCKQAGVPFFLKQMAIGGKLVKMPELDGQTWGQMPEVAAKGGE